MKQLLFGFSLFACSTLAWSQGGTMGGHDGGGGQGVVCYQNGEIKSVELLDFYEGRTLEGLSIGKYEGKYSDIYKEVVAKKAPSSRAKEFLNYASQRIKFTLMQPGERLKIIEDSGSFIIPAGCKIEQVANFQGLNRIFIVSDFWDKMSDTDRAGLYMHEYLWAYERTLGAVEKSVRARRTVARFFATNYEFSGDPVEAKVGDIDCVAGDEVNEDIQPTGFLVSKIEGTNSCKLSFYNLNGERVFNKHEAVLERCDDYKFVGPVQKERVDTGDIVTVTDAQTKDLTHELWINVESKPYDNQGNYERVYTLKINNLEFPNMSDKKPRRFYCNAGITEDDLQNPWW